jgi:hypothetical protein
MNRKAFISIGVALAAIAGCLAYSAKWSYARHKLLDRVHGCAQIYAPHYMGCFSYGSVIKDGDAKLWLGSTDPPLSLWPLGEVGIAAIVFDGKPTDAGLISEAKSLFPEAHVVVALERTDIYSPPPGLSGAGLSAQ